MGCASCSLSTLASNNVNAIGFGWLTSLWNTVKGMLVGDEAKGMSRNDQIKAIEDRFNKVKNEKPELIFKSLMETISPYNKYNKNKKGIFRDIEVVSILEESKINGLIDLLSELERTGALVSMNPVDNVLDEGESAPHPYDEIDAYVIDEDSPEVKRLKEKLSLKKSLTKEGYKKVLRFLSDSLNFNGKWMVLGNITDNLKIVTKHANSVIPGNDNEEFFRFVSSN